MPSPSPSSFSATSADSQPALIDLGPRGRVDLGAGIAQRARAPRPALRRAELRRGVAQQNLFFVQQKVHAITTAD